MKIDRALENMIGDVDIKVPGLGVIVYREGAEVYSKFLGSRTIDNADRSNDKPITRDTRFRAASVSKSFTMFSIMQLIERGLIDLDENVESYLQMPLRNPVKPKKKITVRMLACHTSSIRDGKIYSTPPDVGVEEFFDPNGRYWEGGAHFAPIDEPIGNYFNYSNLNYGLLGTLIERVTGERFDLYQKENILAQLDIKADYVPANFAPNEFNLLGTVYQKKNPRGIWYENGAWYPTVDDYSTQPSKDTIALQNAYAEHFNGTYDLKNYRIGTNATIFSPQGGLRISFEELTHALEMMMNGGLYRGRRVLSEQSIAEMLSPNWIYDPTVGNGNNYGGAINNYGLGVYKIDGKGSARVSLKREIDLIGHTGAAFGLLSGMFFEPNTHNGFVYMINGEAIEEDNDPRSRGKFSGNYIWEEMIMSAVVENIF